MQYSLLALTVALITWTSPVRATRGSRLTPLIFSDYCQRFRDGRTPSLNPFILGEVSYQPTALLQGTQNRYSFYKMREAKKKATKRSKNFFNKHLMHWQFGFDLDECGVGRSMFPPEKYLEGILWDNRIWLSDGHHKALISSYHQAPTVPVKILHDWSGLSEVDFFERMSHVDPNGQRHAYWRDYLGNPEPPVDLALMTDDPNFLLARKSIQRVDCYMLVHPDGSEEFVIERLREADDVLAIKIGNDESYFEARLGDALRRSGVVANNDQRNAVIPDREMIKNHRILGRDRDRSWSDLHHVLLLDKPRQASKIDHEHFILNHVRQPGCEHLLERRLAHAND